VIPSRPGYDLVVTKDAIVEGVHVPKGEAADLIARKLARANLSDLAAKAAQPFGAFLAVAWTEAFDDGARAAFAAGLAEDLDRWDVDLLGGDTVRGEGALVASLTLLGWVPQGRMIRRAGAQPGDLLQVSGTIGDGFLGLQVALGKLVDETGALIQRYRLPTPRLDLTEVLLEGASAAADVSDGLIADARHIADASRVGLAIDLDLLPLSLAAETWLGAQPDEGAARLALATGGDDYEIVCTAADELPGFTVIGEITPIGLEVSCGGRRLDPGAGGWRHR
jgi:thiamine-monophosphate kinase